MLLGRRRLPHRYPEGKALFLTWHLQGTVSSAQFPPPGRLSSGQAFVWMDRHLDLTVKGPLYLKRSEVAKIVVDAIHRGEEQGHYELFAWVVMANHVHMLIEPKIDPSKLMKLLKGTTARDANRLLGMTGTAFWQKGIL